MAAKIHIVKYLDKKSKPLRFPSVIFYTRLRHCSIPQFVIDRYFSFAIDSDSWQVEADSEADCMSHILASARHTISIKSSRKADPRFSNKHLSRLLLGSSRV